MSASSDDPFADAQAQWVFTASERGYVFGFRCEGKDAEEAGLVFVTTEEGDDSVVGVMNATKPMLAIIIDNGERVEFEAELDTVKVSGEKRIRIVASGAETVTLAERIGAAKKRVSVALIAMGKPYHSTNFSVAGSRTKLSAAIKKCGIEPKTK
jgi:hypothetical protein